MLTKSSQWLNVVTTINDQIMPIAKQFAECIPVPSMAPADLLPLASTSNPLGPTHSAPNLSNLNITHPMGIPTELITHKIKTELVKNSLGFVPASTLYNGLPTSSTLVPTLERNGFEIMLDAFRPQTIDPKLLLGDSPPQSALQPAFQTQPPAPTSPVIVHRSPSRNPPTTAHNSPSGLLALSTPLPVAQLKSCSDRFPKLSPSHSASSTPPPVAGSNSSSDRFTEPSSPSTSESPMPPSVAQQPNTSKVVINSAGQGSLGPVPSANNHTQLLSVPAHSELTAHDNTSDVDMLGEADDKRINGNTTSTISDHEMDAGSELTDLSESDKEQQPKRMSALVGVMRVPRDKTDDEDKSSPSKKDAREEEVTEEGPKSGDRGPESDMGDPSSDNSSYSAIKTRSHSKMTTGMRRHHAERLANRDDTLGNARVALGLVRAKGKRKQKQKQKQVGNDTASEGGDELESEETTTRRPVTPPPPKQGLSSAKKDKDPQCLLKFKVEASALLKPGSSTSSGLDSSEASRVLTAFLRLSDDQRAAYFGESDDELADAFSTQANGYMKKNREAELMRSPKHKRSRHN